MSKTVYIQIWGCG